MTNVKPIAGSLRIYQAESKEDLSHVATLFRGYAQLLKERERMSCQGVLEEIALLPADYVPPSGRLLLAKLDEEVAGCGALRQLNEAFCEIRRVYTRPECRGKGIGRSMTLELMSEARKIGYTHARLSTTPVLKEAIGLYESLGFKRIEAYCEDPYTCPIFMEIKL